MCPLLQRHSKLWYVINCRFHFRSLDQELLVLVDGFHYHIAELFGVVRRRAVDEEDCFREVLMCPILIPVCNQTVLDVTGS